MNSKQRRTRRKLKSDIGQLTETARHCFKDGRILPGLVLLYAKEIYYAWRTGKAEDLEEAMNRSNWKTPAVGVYADELLRAVGRGFDKFFRDLPKDPRRAALVYDRAGKWFGGLSTELVEALRDSLDSGGLHPL